MTKQTKLIKFMLVVLLLIPVILFTTAIIQSFILKNSQKKLLEAQNCLNQAQKELDKQNMQ